jgi:hypothetical protein
MKFDYQDTAEALKAAQVEGARVIEIMKICRGILPPQVSHDLEALIGDVLGEAAGLSKQVDLLTGVTKTLAERMAAQEVDRDRLDALAEFGCHTFYFRERARLPLEPGQTIRAACDVLRRELKREQKTEGA